MLFSDKAENIVVYVLQITDENFVHFKLNYSIAFYKIIL